MNVSEITSVESFIRDVSPKVFDDFCSGLGTMFGIEIQTTAQDMRTEQFASLKEQFNELTAMFAIDFKGSINGTLCLILDQKAVFTLPGIIVMQSEQRIEENCKKGAAKDLIPILDSVKELGNLMVGSWDKVVRETLGDNTHLLQIATYAGLLSDLPEDSFIVPEGTDFSYMPFEIKVESYDPFICGVLLTETLLTLNDDA